MPVAATQIAQQLVRLPSVNPAYDADSPGEAPVAVCDKNRKAYAKRRTRVAHALTAADRRPAFGS